MSKAPTTRGLGTVQIDGDSLSTVQPALDIPEYPRGGDPRRRIRLHHLLVRRPRWSRELDGLLENPRRAESFDGVDHLDRTWQERDAIGRELATAGWSP